MLRIEKIADPSYDGTEIPPFQITFTKQKTTLKGKQVVDPATGLVHSGDSTIIEEVYFSADSRVESKIIYKQENEVSNEYQ